MPPPVAGQTPGPVGSFPKAGCEHDMKKILSKAKPILITMGLAIVAVYLWNNQIEPRLTKGKFQA